MCMRVGILLTLGIHLHDCIISVREGVRGAQAHKTANCSCFAKPGASIVMYFCLSVSAIRQLNFGIADSD